MKAFIRWVWVLCLFPPRVFGQAKPSYYDFRPFCGGGSGGGTTRRGNR